MSALAWTACGDGGDGDDDDLVGAPDAADEQTGGADASVDAAPADDAQPGVDATAADASIADAAVADADASVADAAVADASVADASPPDASIPDASPPDATPSFTLSVTSSAGGSITSAPGAIDCTSDGGTCSDVFDQDTVVTLTATPDTDFAFSGWTGDCAGIEAVVEIAITADASCHAAFIGTGGDITLIPPPSSVVPNVTEDDTNIMIFVEQQELTLADPLPIDVHVPKTYARRAADATLPAGLRVNIYFVHYDPVGTGPAINTIASLTFPDPIIGLVTDLPTLEATDALVGAPGVIYPSAGTHADRELELDNSDKFTLHANRRTLDLDLQTSTSSDQIRVVTLVADQTIPRIVSNNLSIDAPPASVVTGAIESGSFLSFVERAAHTLLADLDVDAAAPGLYDANADLAIATVSAGTVVHSQLLHLDPVGTATITRTGSITFDRDILGIILRSASLDATDAILGSPTTTYPAPGSDPARQVELASTETVYLSADGRSMIFTLRAGSGIDQIRVLLAD